MVHPGGTLRAGGSRGLVWPLFSAGGRHLGPLPSSRRGLSGRIVCDWRKGGWRPAIPVQNGQAALQGRRRCASAVLRCLIIPAECGLGHGPKGPWAAGSAVCWQIWSCFCHQANFVLASRFSNEVCMQLFGMYMAPIRLIPVLWRQVPAHACSCVAAGVMHRLDCAQLAGLADFNRLAG